MADYSGIAQQFTEFYYTTFDENRSNLAALYRDHSMLTFESASVQGTSAIVEKLVVCNNPPRSGKPAPPMHTPNEIPPWQDLPFRKVKHQVQTLDAQPSSGEGGIIVMVTGALVVRTPVLLSAYAFRVDEEERPMNYTQVFQLLPDGAGSYFVFNDMFKLIYG
ncbi:MAG: hypothetical protein L6R36_001389 [Xanthoria steineri]|nr:MAG: hypothetical protein L6R36_001389 [Xanthoria steineri]